MSIRSVNQPKSRNQDEAPLNAFCTMRGASLLTACSIALLAFAAAACEQQVANAEQPSQLSSRSTTAALKQDPTPAVEGGKGKLVFDKPGCELPNRGGDVTGECSVIGRINPDRKGHLTYGPYLPLPAGDYIFEVEYRSSADAASSSGRWDVAARLGAEEQVLAKGDISGTANKEQVLTGRFAMPSMAGGTPVLEIRMAPSIAAETEIKRLRIYEVGKR